MKRMFFVVVLLLLALFLVNTSVSFADICRGEEVLDIDAFFRKKAYAGDCVELGDPTVEQLNSLLKKDWKLGALVVRDPKHKIGNPVGDAGAADARAQAHGDSFLQRLFGSVPSRQEREFLVFTGRHLQWWDGMVNRPTLVAHVWNVGGPINQKRLVNPTFEEVRKLVGEGWVPQSAQVRGTKKITTLARIARIRVSAERMLVIKNDLRARVASGYAVPELTFNVTFYVEGNELVVNLVWPRAYDNYPSEED